MLGALLAFISAGFYGTNNACLRRGVLHGSVSQAMSITVPLGVPLFLIAAFLSGQLFDLGKLSARSFLFFSLAGVLHFVWGRYWNYRSTQALGSVGAGPIQQSQLLIAVALAVIFLHEKLTPLKGLGIVLIIIGPTIIALRANNKKKSSSQSHQAAAGENEPATAASPDKGQAFKPQVLIGYGSALLSATGYGVSPVLIRAGLHGDDLSLAGGLIAYVAAALVFLLISCLTPGQLRHIKSMERRSIPWYLLSGLLVFFAQMLRFVALGIAPVTIVSPIQRLSLVARLVAGYLINRQHEIFNRTILVGIAFSLAGSIVLALSEA